MKKLVYSIILAVSIIGTSCEYEFTDEPVDFYSTGDIMKDSTFVMGFVDDLYNTLPDGYNRLGGNSMIASTTDEAVESGIYTEAEYMALGVWSATNVRDDAWNSSYIAIRKANVFLNEISPAIPDRVFRSDKTIDLLVGQSYFLRAFFYFELVKRYGGVPLITDVLSLENELNISRNSYDECISFITSECDKAAAVLPVAWSDPAVNFGKATKGAALALKSKVLLYAASPLFNDPSKPTGMVEHGAYSNEKWQQAAQASFDVINLKTYQLHTSFEAFFTILNNNKEIVFSKMTRRNNNVERLNGPTGFTNGKGGSAPSLNFVDAFQMSDGSSFDRSNPSHAQDPFKNRDPRFYASVLYNGESWMGSVIETFEGGKDVSSVNSTKTGFYLKKFMSESAIWFGGTTGETFHCFPYIRYAEILLNYAEAMNEFYGPEFTGTYGLSALGAVNQVRIRAKMPLLAAGLIKEQMREKIQYERKIELAFEEHRHFDLRRWKLAESVLGEPIYGLKITSNNGSYTYQRTIVQNRVFRPEMYLYPIPQSEINRISGLVQNTGW